MPSKTKWVDDQTIMYTQPIAINNGLCLNCHGKVGELLPDSFYAFIEEKYPDDEAINYDMGDLRGMWSIKFDKTVLQEQ